MWGWGTAAGKSRARRRAGLIAAAAALSPGVRVLEIGCGTGMFTEMFAASGAEITAVDLSPDLLTIARERELPSGQVTFVNARFEDCSTGEGFDAIIGSSVLHHLDVEPAVRKIYRLLKPGGRMAFAEPNLLNPQVYMQLKLRFLPMFWYISPDEGAFYRHRLARLLGAIGFADVRTQAFDWLHPSVPTRGITGALTLGNLLEKTPVLREFAGSLLIRATRPA
ncbi:MAG: methyltransferase domain-containing protein [Deltaproteobacteria bacterium]|nr:methyltransferase domain-containing protein [Deltaproteobacteria bacterium]